jgi:hypothetical protein
MFALHKIIENKLYAIKTGKDSDAFTDCFNNWQDATYVFNCFKGKEEALLFYGMDKKQAAQQVLKESQQFYLDILNIINGKTNATSLDHTIFIPLYPNTDFDLPLLETKAYGTEAGKSFLRMYAIRLNDGCYIVVGGLIKTSKTLQDSKEGKAILKRIKQVAKFLREKNYTDAFDIALIVS